MLRPFACCCHTHCLPHTPTCLVYLPSAQERLLAQQAGLLVLPLRCVRRPCRGRRAGISPAGPPRPEPGKARTRVLTASPSSRSTPASYLCTESVPGDCSLDRRCRRNDAFSPAPTASQQPPPSCLCHPPIARAPMAAGSRVSVSSRVASLADTHGGTLSEKASFLSSAAGAEDRPPALGRRDTIQEHSGKIGAHFQYAAPREEAAGLTRRESIAGTCRTNRPGCRGPPSARAITRTRLRSASGEPPDPTASFVSRLAQVELYRRHGTPAGLGGPRRTLHIQR